MVPGNRNCWDQWDLNAMVAAVAPIACRRRLRPPMRRPSTTRSPDGAGSYSEESGTPESVGSPLARTLPPSMRP